MITVGIAAPFTPPVGGATIASEVLWAELLHREDVNAIKLEHNQLLKKMSSRGFNQVQRDLRYFVREADVVSVHGARNGMTRFGPPIARMNRLRHKPLVLRLFGGTLWKWAQERPVVRRSRLGVLFAHATVLLETQSMVRGFLQWYPDADIRWFPNHRPLRAPEDRPRRDRRFRFAYVGDVCDRKGVGRLIEGVRRSKADWSLEVYGPPRDGFDVRRLTSTDRVNYHGVVSAQVLQTMLLDHDALALPSTHPGEGYPGAVIEAFAAGIPVIASDWLSIPEIVHDHRNGLLVPPKNIDALVEAMDQLSTDETLYDNLRVGARESGVGFSAEVWGGWFVDLCKELHESTS